MRRFVLIIVAIGLFAYGFDTAWDLRPEYDRLEHAAPYYSPLKNSLYRGLAENNFAHVFASAEDRTKLHAAFAFLDQAPTPREKVLRLIAWIDKETKTGEITSVRAIELYEKRSGACEIHALAVGVLAAFDVRARWIGNVKSSIGFGYLEAFVDGKWELFRLRSGKPDPSLQKSAWDLYLESEPSLSIRNFWWKPDQSWRSWKGPVHPVLLPFANVVDHPELETIFRTDRGLDIWYRTFNPFEYVYAYFGAADAEWTINESVMEMFEWHFGTSGMARQRRDAAWINWLGLAQYSD